MTNRLYMLSFDHRNSFKKGLLKITADPTEAQRHRISELKAIIYEGFTQAIADGAPSTSCALLVDEEFGADIAERDAAAAQIATNYRQMIDVYAKAAAR